MNYSLIENSIYTFVASVRFTINLTIANKPGSSSTYLTYQSYNIDAIRDGNVWYDYDTYVDSILTEKYNMQSNVIDEFLHRLCPLGDCICRVDLNYSNKDDYIVNGYNNAVAQAGDSFNGVECVRLESEFLNLMSKHISLVAGSYTFKIELTTDRIALHNKSTKDIFSYINTTNNGIIRLGDLDTIAASCGDSLTGNYENLHIHPDMFVNCLSDDRIGNHNIMPYGTVTLETYIKVLSGSTVNSGRTYQILALGDSVDFRRKYIGSTKSYTLPPVSNAGYSVVSKIMYNVSTSDHSSNYAHIVSLPKYPAKQGLYLNSVHPESDIVYTNIEFYTRRHYPQEDIINTVDDIVGIPASSTNEFSVPLHLSETCTSSLDGELIVEFYANGNLIHTHESTSFDKDVTYTFSTGAKTYNLVIKARVRMNPNAQYLDTRYSYDVTTVLFDKTFNLVRTVHSDRMFNFKVSNNNVFLAGINTYIEGSISTSGVRYPIPKDTSGKRTNCMNCRLTGLDTRLVAKMFNGTTSGYIAYGVFKFSDSTVNTIDKTYLVIQGRGVSDSLLELDETKIPDELQLVNKIYDIYADYNRIFVFKVYSFCDVAIEDFEYFESFLDTLYDTIA